MLKTARNGKRAVLHRVRGLESTRTHAHACTRDDDDENDAFAMALGRPATRITVKDAKAELQRILANAIRNGGHIDDICEAGWVLHAARAAPKVRGRSAQHGDAVRIVVGLSDEVAARTYGSRCFRVVFADTSSCSISTGNLAQALARPRTAVARRAKNHLDAQRRSSRPSRTPTSSARRPRASAPWRI